MLYRRGGVNETIFKLTGYSGTGRLNGIDGQHHDAVVSIIASQQKGPGFESQLEEFVGGVCMFSHDIHIKLIGH